MSLLRPMSLTLTPARSARPWFAAAVAGFVSLFLALVLSTWAATTAWACSCAVQDLSQQVTTADGVFRGVVERVRVPTGNQVAGDVLTVRPTQVWKGDTTERLEVIDGLGQGGSACAQDLAVGDDVLFMVAHTDAGWQSGLCSGTERYSPSRASDIAGLLGSGTQISITPLPPLPAPEDHAPAYWYAGGALVLLCVGGAILIRRRRRS